MAIRYFVQMRSGEKSIKNIRLLPSGIICAFATPFIKLFFSSLYVVLLGPWENMMPEQFGDEWADYAVRTQLLIPTFGGLA